MCEAASKHGVQQLIFLSSVAVYGVEGRAVALVSGGFDSAVAAWQMMKRGVTIDFVFCNIAPTDEEGQKEA